MSKLSVSLDSNTEYFIVHDKNIDKVRIFDPDNINYRRYEQWTERDKFSVEKVTKGEIAKRLITGSIAQYTARLNVELEGIEEAENNIDGVKEKVEEAIEAIQEFYDWVERNPLVEVSNE